MSVSELEQRVSSLEERLKELESNYKELLEIEFPSDTAIERGREAEEWIKSGNKHKLVKID